MEIKPLEDLVADLQQSNERLLPGTQMLVVTDNGACMVGILLPSGQVLGPGGVVITPVWSCEARVAVRVIGSLENVLDKCRKQNANA